MLDINSFGIIGGDKRQLFCARSMADDGYGVFLTGFDKSGDMLGLKNSDISVVINSSDAFILPLPISKDGITVFAPFSENSIEISDIIRVIGSKKPVFCGINGAVDENTVSSMRLFRYSSREEFSVANALPTAEGALEIAMREYDGTVSGSRCIVIGYGRIGRVLSLILKGIGADVTVAARKIKDREFIRALGMTPVPVDNMVGKYDLVFNTVPAMVLDSHTLARIASEAIVIDLASLPGGVDDNAAERMSIRVFHALSLPGKAAPKTAGIIIKNAVYNIIEEEEL